MKIIDKRSEHDIYKVGNVIESGGELYLIVEDGDNVRVLSLSESTVEDCYRDIDDLVLKWGDECDHLVQATLTIE